MLVKKNRPSFHENPVAWWQNYQNKFPLIYALALKYPAAPAISVDCERLFSMAGTLYENKRRGRLNGRNARLLLTIRAHQFETAQRYVYLTGKGFPELSNYFLPFRRHGSRIRVMNKRRKDITIPTTNSAFLKMKARMEMMISTSSSSTRK
ncbi:unnamed protein product [Heligmosomoides polygyrus]|uniref:Dimer_Tnp_hAT domain-containing protein n=1 Tax=Heligmosomoides polygyrus TaxID=6339 RepID=A0A183F1V9_HELPZ|nr:unnamed protein product [Heligmosomoides polygyrus]